MTQPGVDRQPLTLGRTLRRHRLEQGWSLRHAAKALGIGASTLLDYEQDKRLPPEGFLQSTERILGATPDALTGLRRRALAAKAVSLTSPKSDDRVIDHPAPVKAHLASGAPDAAVTEALEPETASARLPLRIGSLQRSVGLMLCGALAALAIQDLPTVIMHTGIPRSRPQPVAHASSVAPPLPGAGDDKDPRDSGCDADATTLGLNDIVVNQPDRIVIGQVLARYSPRCRALWTRFEPTGALDRLAPHAIITLTATRPVDSRHLQFRGAYEGVFMWGNMLLTSSGCVITSVTITDPALRATPTASTGCLSGLGPATSGSPSGG